MADMASLISQEGIKILSKPGDRIIKQLLNLVIAKHHDLSESRRSIICASLRLQQIIDLLMSDKTQYFAQPHPIIFKYSTCCACHVVFNA